MNNKRPHVSYKTDETFDLNKIHSYGCKILVYRQYPPYTTALRYVLSVLKKVPWLSTMGFLF